MNDSLRKYIHVANMLSEAHSDNIVAVNHSAEHLSEEDFVMIPEEVKEEISNLIFKLRAYQDPEMGEYAAGMEAGMSRAADMLQNLLDKYQG